MEEQFNALNVQLDDCERTLDDMDNFVDKQMKNIHKFNATCEGLEEWLPTALNSSIITESISFLPDDLLRQDEEIKVRCVVVLLLFCFAVLLLLVDL